MYVVVQQFFAIFSSDNNLPELLLFNWTDNTLRCACMPFLTLELAIL